MNNNIPFQTIDWSTIPKTEHKGETGMAYWQTLQFEGLRIRLVEYSKGYVADHWCTKGHIVHCLEGDFVSELNNGQQFILTKGMTYVVSDELSSHRSTTVDGVKLLIIDGDFLKLRNQ
ncbi:MAG: DHCW motif cupin fold protein [Bacteroidales bacterium]|nr:DHCW motif cupin fold protein [Bacteroidales bacterium]MDD3521677.1 DHCW motif cupin fold protein [Bacteroidales bacterium]MDD4435903.1 DHCW motif cupin fold protein [Bacteroidales bacterium]